MKRKIAFLFCVIIIVFCKENYAKYIVEQTILIAEINIDTIFPEIELISITETPEKEQYKVNFQIKVVENNIKINKFKSFDPAHTASDHISGNRMDQNCQYYCHKRNK